MRRLFLCILILKIGLFCVIAQVQSHQFSEIAPGVWTLQGNIETLEDSSDGFIANVSFVVGKDAVAVIDTGSSKRQGLWIRKQIKLISRLPIKYVINTHVHPDHIFGNQAFEQDSPQFISHYRYPADFSVKAPYYHQRITNNWFKDSRPIAANRLIKGEQQINLGNRILKLVAHDRAHTLHDLTVYDVQTATLFSGDLLFVDHCPSLDGQLRGWIRATEALIKHEFKRLVPGHGPLQTDRSGLKKQLAYLKLLVKEVKLAIDQQISIDTASRTVMQGQAKNWQLFKPFHQRNIIQAYKELEWED